jgi:hypothetical protein
MTACFQSPAKASNTVAGLGQRAALLVQDGWTLEAAINARHEDTADDHCRKHR